MVMSHVIVNNVAIAVVGGIWNDRCNPCTPDKIIKCEECLNAAKTAIKALRELPKNTFKNKTDLIIWSYLIDEIGKNIVLGDNPQIVKTTEIKF